MNTNIQALFVLYDDRCEFCRRCAAWLENAEQCVPLSLIPRSSEKAKKHFSNVLSGHDELVVVASNGGVYKGADAFVVALWALDDYREWSYWISEEPLRQKTRALFHWLSTRRQNVSNYLKMFSSEDIVQAIDENSQTLPDICTVPSQPVKRLP